jgi:hypothetical protein
LTRENPEYHRGLIESLDALHARLSAELQAVDEGPTTDV